MKKSLFAATLALAISVPAFADNEGTCYELSLDGRAWSRTPEQLCVKETGQGYGHEIVLSTASIGGAVERGRLNLDLVARARCLDCNQDVFGVSNPSNSVFNALAVRFNGRSVSGGREEGQVSIGKTTYYYRSLR